MEFILAVKMSGQFVAFTKSGVVIADGAIAAINLFSFAVSGEAVVFVVKSVDNNATWLRHMKNEMLDPYVPLCHLEDGR